MEFLNWKNILLEWANRLNFLGRAHYSLNMVEIESFYSEFQANIRSKDIASKKLDSFLSSYFPEFQPNWTKEGKLSPDDYVYGYSLLMYFACVKHPDENIQKICKEMQEESQLVVRAFLQNLLDSNSFSRATIKCVIESSAPAKLSDYVLALSPTKITEMNMCPATPKSKILNEWNVENRQLRAQVETERFERGFLEAQLKKKEDEINDLHQERRKFLADIQQLKSQLTEKDTENIPANYNDSQIILLKRRLRKDIADKESEINKLQSEVDKLTISNQHFAEKLSLVESQYNNSVECSAEWANKLKELTETCDKQQEHIKGLEINIKEYQKYFNESSSRGNSLEMSSENLEDSFAIAMANMPDRSMSSPENMGKVVDIQLREQIALYETLQEKCIGMESENSQLKGQIEEQIQRTSALELKFRQIMDENAMNVRLNEEKTAELVALSKELEPNVSKLQSLRVEFDSLTLKVNDNHRTIEDLNDAKSSLQQQLNACENETAELRTHLETANTQVNAAESLRSHLAVQHEEILHQKDVMLAKVEMERLSLRDQVNELKSSLFNAEQIHVKLETQSGELGLALEKQTEQLSAELLTVSELADCRTDRDSIQQTVADLMEQIASLTAERQKIDSQLADLTLTNGKVMCERDQLRDELTTIEKDRAEVEARLNAVECSRADLEAQLSQSEDEKEKLFLNLQEKIDEVEATDLTVKQWSHRYENETAKYESAVKRNKLACEAYESRVSELTNSVSELTAFKENLTKVNDDLREETSQMRIALETMRIECEQHNNEKKQYLESIEGLSVCKNSNEDEVCQLQQKLLQSNEVYVELVGQHNELQTENQSLKQTVDDLERKRDELINKLDVAERQVADTHEHLHQKGREVDELSKALDALKSESATGLVEKAKVETELQHNVDLVKQLSKELEENKTDLVEKSQLMELLRDQMEKLKVSEISMSKDCEALAKKVELTEASRDSLSVQCTSLTEELIAVQDKCNESENKFADINSQASAREDVIKTLELQVDSLKQEIASMSEKHLYTEETSKSKEKHERQERELMNYKHQCQLLDEKVDKFVTHVRSISEQLYKLNEQNLELKKENEFLKSKLRLAECNPRESRLFPPPTFGSNLKIEMEDEEGEVFNNTYLADLKSGVTRTSPVGRESIRQSELRQRNSIAARHLRSTYAAQYGDQNLKEEDISMPYFNDSMFSNQLDVRRGTLYQRPGPPTPSKNGGRLSFGGSIINASDLFPKDILREQNTNAKTKTTPGKLMSMFSSSKHKENDLRKAVTRPIYATFTSSTPRQKSNLARERKSILAIKLNSSELTDCDDDDAVSIVSNDSLLSKTGGRRITRRYSIISKTKQFSAVSSLIQKNRNEYRKKNHSKRQKGFEQSREIFFKTDDDDDNNFQMVLREEIGYIQPNELFELDLRPSEKFEILTKRTISEHPYSNDPTAIEPVEASENSLTSSAVCQSKTMGNIIMYGKIPRITVNETPQRELIRLNQSSTSVRLKLMDLTKEVFLVLAVIVVYASYVMWNFLSRKNG